MSIYGTAVQESGEGLVTKLGKPASWETGGSGRDCGSQTTYGTNQPFPDLLVFLEILEILAISG